ncbi:MAG: hypothetical protein JXR63_07280 [Spirochaetales bacterium]|nr:hypothetical protein [Spirochaetales bacterium]
MKKLIYFFNTLLMVGFVAGIIFYSSYFITSQRQNLEKDFQFTTTQVRDRLENGFSAEKFKNICLDNPYLKDLRISRGGSEIFKYTLRDQELSTEEFDKEFNNFFTKYLSARRTITVNNYQVKIIFSLFDKLSLKRYFTIIIVASSAYVALILLMIILLPLINKKNNTNIESKLSIDFIEKVNSLLNNAYIEKKDLSICFIKINSSKIFSSKFHDPFSMLDNRIKFSDGYIEVGDKIISLLLPSSKLKETFKLMSGFSSAINHIDPKVKLSIGISSLNNRQELSSSLFVKECSEALKKAEQERSINIIAFMADPEKYSKIF